ncbi:MAG TPA: NAD-dependent epimerase/dehydratase family protein [Myxococcota bacterium]|nr:NAD-dependent epimerase/dehydratase family protein [Myxococcota bacterium]
MESDSQQKICVLGGGGFLGSHLVEALCAKTDFSVQAVDTVFNKLTIESPRLTITRADIAASGVLDQVVENNHVLISTTALCNPSQYNTWPVDVIRESYDHLVPLVDLCARHGRWLVHFSTCEAYGKPLPGAEGQPMQEDETPLLLGPVCKERWSYACAKQLLERLIWAQGRHHGLDFTIIRPFNVIGPRMDFIPGLDGEGLPRVLACFMRALLVGEPLRLVNGGAQRRSFIYVDDFIAGVIAILQDPSHCRGEIINIGHPGNDVSIAELAAKMIAVFSELYGKRPGLGVESVSADEFYGPGYDDCDRRVPDICKAERLVGFKPQTGLEEMLPVIIRDYVARYGEAFQVNEAAR